MCLVDWSMKTASDTPVVAAGRRLKNGTRSEFTVAKLEKGYSKVSEAILDKMRPNQTIYHQIMHQVYINAL